VFICFWPNTPQCAMVSSFTMSVDQTQRLTTDGRTPMYGWSTRRKALYLTTLTKDKRPFRQWDSNP